MHHNLVVLQRNGNGEKELPRVRVEISNSEPGDPAVSPPPHQMCHFYCLRFKYIVISMMAAMKLKDPYSLEGKL